MHVLIFGIISRKKNINQEQFQTCPIKRPVVFIPHTPRSALVTLKASSSCGRCRSSHDRGLQMGFTWWNFTAHLAGQRNEAKQKCPDTLQLKPGGPTILTCSSPFWLHDSILKGGDAGPPLTDAPRFEPRTMQPQWTRPS